MRKDYLSKVVVQIIAMVQDKFGVSVSHEHAPELLGFALALGYVTGKRGRDGGYLVTDTGLELIGEDVASFRAEEAQINATKAAQQKQTRKAAAKARKAQLAANIANALPA